MLVSEKNTLLSCPLFLHILSMDVTLELRHLCCSQLYKAVTFSLTYKFTIT